MKTLLSILLLFLSLSAYSQADVVTFEDKDKTIPAPSVRRLVRDVDLNELKAVINQHATEINSKQATLESGSTIKTVNGNSVLGSGDIDLVDDAIVNGELKAPSQNALYDALQLKANLASPTFTGTVSGITKSMVGLGNVDNTTDLGKPISTATQTALNLKTTTTNFAVGITVVGSVNSSNTVFTIAQTVVTGSVEVFINGLRVADGVDYAITYPGDVATITFTEAPETGDVIRVNYIRP